jgi:hypothetical protein
VEQLLTFMIALVEIFCQAIAQEKQGEKLLDGTPMDYYYQNGSAVHAEFSDGQFKYKWIAGPNKEVEGSEEYRSRKIADKTYMVNFMVQANSSFVTIVFNYNQNVMSPSALLAPGTDQELVLFEAGIIEQLTLKEK